MFAYVLELSLNTDILINIFWMNMIIVKKIIFRSSEIHISHYDEYVIIVFWIVSLYNVIQHFGVPCYLHLHGSFRALVIPTRLHVVTTQKTTVYLFKGGFIHPNSFRCGNHEPILLSKHVLIMLQCTVQFYIVKEAEHF